MTRNETIYAYVEKSHNKAQIISYLLKYHSEAIFWIYHQVPNNYKKRCGTPLTRRAGRKKTVVETTIDSIIFQSTIDEEIIIERMNRDIAKIVKSLSALQKNKKSAND